MAMQPLMNGHRGGPNAPTQTATTKNGRTEANGQTANRPTATVAPLPIKSVPPVSETPLKPKTPEVKAQDPATAVAVIVNERGTGNETAEAAAASDMTASNNNASEDNKEVITEAKGSFSPGDASTQTVSTVTQSSPTKPATVVVASPKAKMASIVVNEGTHV